MAVAKPRKTQRKSLFKIISVLVIVSVIIGCVISFIMTQSELSDMQAELKSLQEQTKEIEEDNVELQRILEDDDLNAYMEKVAIEEMNYAYPNERRYYDTSRN